MSQYPDTDYPWTFYFNGTALPKWSQCWAACNMLDLARSAMRDWDERITYHDLWLLWCRMDHVGTVESEDPLRFQVLALQMLSLLLTEEAAVLDSLAPLASEQSTPAEVIYGGIRDGLFQMHEAVARDGIAFWTTGYEADRLLLVETIRRHRLPTDHPDHIEAPHVSRDRNQAKSHWETLRSQLMALIRTGILPKALRTHLHNLAKPT